MGKKRIIKKTGAAFQDLKARALERLPKRKLESGILHIQSTYNNTLLSLSDLKGEIIFWVSAGSLGFKGSRKSTPFAASRAAELLAEKAKKIGLKEIGIKVKGAGAGREAAIRSFASKDFVLKFIKDITPLPHNGPRPPKRRRV